jgi:hypothetical protein
MGRKRLEFADRIFSIPSIAAAVSFVLLGLHAIRRRQFSKVEAVIAMCTIGSLREIFGFVFVRPRGSRSGDIFDRMDLVPENARRVCAGLVVLDVHFLSDVIAGTLVGVSVGLFTVATWKAIEPVMRSAEAVERPSG